MQLNFGFEGYYYLISKLLESDYVFCKFINKSSSLKSPYVIMRHDIDFSLESALQIALKERDLGILASYFFHIRSPLYNLLSPYSLSILGEIHSCGHDVGLHIDLSQYSEGYQTGIVKELDTFSKYCNFVNKSIISFHRPSSTGLPLADIKMHPGIMHTYQKEFFTDIAYFSDSRNEWGTSGNPILSNAYKQRLPMQIVTHPLWWTVVGNSAIQKFHNYIRQNSKMTVQHLEKTAVSFSLQVLRDLLENPE